MVFIDALAHATAGSDTKKILHLYLENMKDNLEQMVVAVSNVLIDEEILSRSDGFLAGRVFERQEHNLFEELTRKVHIGLEEGVSHYSPRKSQRSESATRSGLVTPKALPKGIDKKGRMSKITPSKPLCSKVLESINKNSTTSDFVRGVSRPMDTAFYAATKKSEKLDKLLKEQCQSPMCLKGTFRNSGIRLLLVLCEITVLRGCCGPQTTTTQWFRSSVAEVCGAL